MNRKETIEELRDEVLKLKLKLIQDNFNETLMSNKLLFTRITYIQEVTKLLDITEMVPEGKTTKEMVNKRNFIASLGLAIHTINNNAKEFNYDLN